MKISKITKINNHSNRYDIQTGTENFFANGVLVHNSMIHTVIADNGTVKMKSKKTFSSDVAQAAEKFVSENSTTLGQFINAVANRNWTAVFEWTAPDARIVLLYMKPELQLLHLRDNESGQYIDHDEMKKLAANFNVKCVDEVEDFWELSSSESSVFNAEKMLDAAKTQEGIEGWVVQFKNGDMVKVKTEWYLRRHRAMTFLRERDIVELTLDEGLDDLKSLLVSEGAEISEIIEIENKVVNDIGSILTLIDSIIEKDGKMERKEFAIKYMNNDAIPTGVFGLLMARYTGKELNVKDWYRKNVLKEKWTLRQLVLVPTIAEGD
jgi:RNA ligase